MPVYIQNIATSVPEVSVEQPFMREKMEQYMAEKPVIRRIIHRIYSNSGIERRHTVVDDFHSNGHAELFFKKSGKLGRPSTKTRNKIYIRHAKKLFVETAAKLLSGNTGIKKEEITHVITVSCTGFFAPEPAYEIVKGLQLSPSTKRFHVGFMGCFAAFTALNMAHSFCKANPDAVVMLVSVELCSLHLQNSTETDQLISASIFADGAAGAIVSNRKPPSQKPTYRIDGFQTSIAPQSEDDMAWIVGNTGFEMVLSRAVPEIIGANLIHSITPLLEAYNLDYNEIDYWPVHPGGRAILDKIEQQLQLKPEQISPSRRVLSQFGNMSSATILFVLKELLDAPSNKMEESALAMAFGPGLTIESALLTKLNGGS